VQSSVSLDEIEANQHRHIGKNIRLTFVFNLIFCEFRIRTRVYAQGFVVSLMTAAAIYHTIKDRSVEHDIHGKVIDRTTTTGAANSQQ